MFKYPIEHLQTVQGAGWRLGRMPRKAFCQALNVLSTGAHCAWSKRHCDILWLGVANCDCYWHSPAHGRPQVPKRGHTFHGAVECCSSVPQAVSPSDWGSRQNSSCFLAVYLLNLAPLAAPCSVRIPRVPRVRFRITSLALPYYGY